MATSGQRNPSHKETGRERQRKRNGKEMRGSNSAADPNLLVLDQFFRWKIFRYLYLKWYWGLCYDCASVHESGKVGVSRRQVLFESIQPELRLKPRRGIFGYDRRARRINKAAVDLDAGNETNGISDFYDESYAAFDESSQPTRPRAIVLSSFMRSGQLKRPVRDALKGEQLQ